MKRIVSAVIIALIASATLALPTPKDISAAVNSGNLSQAESMLHEVIKEKPGSAKAHFELGQVLAKEGRKIEAGQELAEAQRIDPSLKFASDPQHFRELLNKLSSAAPVARVAEPVAIPASPATVHADSGLPWGYLLFGGGALLLVWFVIRRSQSVPVVGQMNPAGVSMGGGAASAGGFGGYGPGGYAPPQQGAGSGIGGAVLGGVAGLAAGYGLAKVLEGSGATHTSQGVDDSRGFTPIQPAAQDDFGSFDAGQGDSWDSGGDGGGDSSSGSDNW